MTHGYCGCLAGWLIDRGRGDEENAADPTLPDVSYNVPHVVNELREGHVLFC